MFRLVIFTENEPHFVLPLVQQICEELYRELTIAAIVVTEKFGNRTLLSNVKRFYPLLKLKGVILTIIDNLKFKLIAIIKNKYKHSLKSISRSYNIPVYLAQDINNPAFEKILKSINPDFGVSISFGQVLKSNIINIPQHGFVNLHASLLPDYRGLMPNFWVLLNRDKTTGVTVHYINEGIDTGEIILQERFPIPLKTTYYELAQFSKKIGGQCLVEAIRKIKSGEEIITLDVKGQGGYYGFPEKEDFDKFRKNGGHYR